MTATVTLGVGAGFLWYSSQRGPVGPDGARMIVDRQSVREQVPIESSPTAIRSTREEPLWRSVDETAVGRLPAFEDDWSEEGRQLVDVSGAVAAAPGWRVGDLLTIEVPQLGERYQSTIDRIDEGPGYSRSVRGLIVGDDGKSRRLVVTVGPTRVFAYVDTAQGPYELVGDTRLGWLLPSSSMMAGWDFSQPDYLLPEPDEVGDAR